MDKIAIIRINSLKLDRIPNDLVKMRLLGIKESEFLIPMVRVFRGKLKGEVFFEDKPLLLSYGFIRLPLTVLCNREHLIKLASSCEVIQSFFLRNVEDIKREIKGRGEAMDLAKNFGISSDPLFHIPVLVKTIPEEQVQTLFNRAKEMDNFSITDSLQIGSYVVLQNYPFEGISAMVLEKRANGKVKLELLDSGIIITQQYEALVYSLDTDLFNT